MLLFSLLFSFFQQLTFIPLLKQALRTQAYSKQRISNANDYTTYGSIVRSYLYRQSGGYVRVEYSADIQKVIIENYSGRFALLSYITIDPELPMFGGFYCGENYNFLVFGQNNPEESDSAEVMRIVKYSKSWERLGSASVFGANTSKMFVAGSLRFAENNGRLYIRTCHEMYLTDDGKHHQSNMTFVTDINSMTVTYSNFEITNVGTGYVSHSFNQFIAVDKSKNNVIAMDHGDAYPRSLVLFNYSGSLNKSILKNPDNVDVFNIAGAEGDNTTGASIGGLEISENNYISVFNSKDQNVIGAQDIRNVYFSATSKNNFSTGGTKCVKLTDYKNSGSVSAGTPCIVSIDSNKYMVMWTVKNVSGKVSVSSGKISYVTVDENGNMLSDIYTSDGALSDCSPILSGDKIVWYVTENSAPVFLSVDINSPENVKVAKCFHAYNVEAILNLSCTNDGIYRNCCMFCGYTYDSVVKAEGHKDANNDGICDICTVRMPTQNNKAQIKWDKNIYRTTDSKATATVVSDTPVYLTEVILGMGSYSYVTSGRVNITFSFFGDLEPGVYYASFVLSDGQILTSSFMVTNDGNEPVTIPETTTEYIPETTTEYIPETTEEPISETTTEPISEETSEQASDELPSETTSEEKPTVTVPESTTKEDPKPQIIYGDLDGNGRVTTADARYALRISAKLDNATPEQLTAADVNKDGKVTATDARLILRFAAKLIIDFD